MKELIKRLEEAEEGSRELDREVANLVGTYRPRVMVMNAWFNEVEQSPETFPHYTTSLDASLTLVPEGCALDIRTYPGCPVEVFWETDVKANPYFWDGGWAQEAATPALALCIASLKARR